MLKRRSRGFTVDMPKQWCDLWHTYVDWEGQGNASWRERRRYLSALLLMLARARKELRQYGKPYQVFALVYPRSSADDALYVHTPNPNGTPFPCEHTDAKRLAAIPPLLAGRVDPGQYSILAVGRGKARYFIVTPNET